ncbi:MAG: Na+/H+ antiporter NhaA [Lewinellaceae bacterium]|nr:Na+/H+ antiporter NhaA [Phaeodactylibacter sp.]MCB9351849.1 Na+/H+ antiporter NhaA [Lewinellaceae bacterium]
MQPSQLIHNLTLPFRQFIRQEASSGILLIICTVIALAWANSPLSGFYFSLWETPVSVTIGTSSFSKPLLLWVNDGLMAIFFFSIGLEIKREVIDGELSSFRKAALPMVAALGGMLVPAGLFFLLHRGNEGIESWGIPMATDIAFSLGILSLLGSRAPLSLKVFLTAFAIVDDIGAVLVIALFYAHEVDWNALAISASLLAFLFICNFLFSIKRNWVYIIVGAGVWYYVFKSGIHPTIAGVLVAFTVPATNNIRLKHFTQSIRDFLDDFRIEKAKEGGPFLPQKELDTLAGLKSNVRAVQPPLQRMEYLLNDFVAYFVMPLFALANAGVMLRGGLEVAYQPLFLHIAVALLVGKIVGIVVFSWVAVRLRVAGLPTGANWTQMAGLGFLGGIGFTMALFIANLALEDGALLAQAKLGILAGSLVAGALGYFLLRWSLPQDETG